MISQDLAKVVRGKKRREREEARETLWRRVKTVATRAGGKGSFECSKGTFSSIELTLLIRIAMKPGIGS